MSWHGFKKAVNRASVQIMQKTGVIEKTEDVEFMGEERRIKEAEKRIERLQKDGKGCLDAMHTLTSGKIVDDLGILGLESNREMPRFREMWKMMEELVNNELDPAFRQVLLQPAVRLGEVVKKAQEGAKRRTNKLLDYDQARSKSKRATDPSKQDRAQSEEAVAKRTFEQLDEALGNDLPIMQRVVDAVLAESKDYGNKLQGLLVGEIADGLAFIPEPPEKQREMSISEAMERIRGLRIASQIS